MSRDLVKSLWDFPSIFRDGVDLFDKSLSGLTVSEDDNHVYVEAPVPGVAFEDIHVEFEKGYLTIYGEVKEEEKKKKYYKKSQNIFSYALNVPGNVDANREIQAVCKNGVLKVTFQKSETKSLGKKIPVKGS